MKKSVDPNEIYKVRRVFGCGEGHFLPPGFTHWESGEACPHGHSPEASNEDCHLYWRNVLVPVKANDGSDLWKKLLEHPNTWAHCPVAP